MNRERRRILRLRLFVGIVAGMAVGTVHALVSHVIARGQPDAASIQQSAARPTGSHAAAR